MIAGFTIAHRGCRRNPEAVDNADHAADRGCMLQRKFLRSDVFEFTFEKKNAVRVEGNFLADACDRIIRGSRSSAALTSLTMVSLLSTLKSGNGLFLRSSE